MKTKIKKQNLVLYFKIIRILKTNVLRNKCIKKTNVLKNRSIKTNIFKTYLNTSVLNLNTSTYKKIKLKLSLLSLLKAN